MTDVPSSTRAVVLLTIDGGEQEVARIGPDAGCDLEVLNQLLHFALMARRCGGAIRLTHTHPDLVALSELMGVSGVLGL